MHFMTGSIQFKDNDYELKRRKNRRNRYRFCSLCDLDDEEDGRYVVPNCPFYESLIESTKRFYSHVQKLAQDDVPEFTRLDNLI
jgi:hypothetical protein